MAVTQAGSTQRFTPGTANTGSIGSITVPADAELVIFCFSSWHSTANFFSSGAVDFTKGGTQVAMTVVPNTDNNGTWKSGLFWLVLPDTGSGKTLNWDWASTPGTEADTVASMTFWKGVDTADPVRDSDGNNATGAAVSTPTLTAQSGDLIVAAATAHTGGDLEGSVDSWSNLTLLEQIAHNTEADIAWATGSPSGNTTVGTLTGTNWLETSIGAIVLKASGGGGQPPLALSLGKRFFFRGTRR